jgi:O-antigen/teichoic acid export membrane protein
MQLKLRADPITRGWAVLTSAEAGRLVLGLVASLAIARALGPAQFGVYAVLGACVGIVGALAEGGLTQAAVLRMAETWRSEPDEARARARGFFWARVGLATVVVAIACVFAVPLASGVLGLHSNDAALLLVWALLGVVATACSGAVSGMLQATGAFGRMSMLTLANTGLTAVLAVVLALTQQLTLLTALVVLGIATSLITFTIGAWLLPGGWTLRPLGFGAVRAEARQLLRTSGWLWLAAIFAMLAGNLDVLVLNHFGDLTLVGAYALAVSLASKAQVVNHSLYTVLLPNAARLSTRAEVGRFVRTGMLRSGLIGAALLALLPLAEPFILIVYGVEYAAAIDLFRLLLGVVIFDVLATPLLLLAMAYRRPQLMAAADAVRALTVGGLAIGLVPSYGATGAVAARLIARVAGAALVLLALRQKL